MGINVILFQNMAYLLIMSGENFDRGLEYMQKIVQLPFHFMPMIKIKHLMR